MNRSKLFAFSLFLALSAAPAFAQSDQSMQGMHGQGMQGMQGQGMQGMNMQGMGQMKMMGMHQMSATVTSVDMNTGIMEATSEGMKLRLHFPPASLTTVKAGDKIMLHMGFMKQ